MSDNKPWDTIAFDLDGTLVESYWPHYPESEIINMPPIPGSIDVVRLVKAKGFRVAIWTSRGEDKRDVTVKWLAKHEVPYDELWFNKPRVLVTVDDRVIHFDGQWEGLIGRITNFRPWWMIKENPQTFEEALHLSLQKQRVIMDLRQRKYGARNMREAGLLGALNRARQDKINRIARVYEREFVRDLALKEGMPQEVVDRWLPSLRADFGDELLEDAHVDAANYLGPISIMLLRGWWGLPMGENTNPNIADLNS